MVMLLPISNLVFQLHHLQLQHALLVLEIEVVLLVPVFVLEQLEALRELVSEMEFVLLHHLLQHQFVSVTPLLLKVSSLDQTATNVDQGFMEMIARSSVPRLVE